MSDAVLVLNSGSSSIKFGLFDLSRTEPELLSKGLLDEHEAKPQFTVSDAAGKRTFEKRLGAEDTEGSNPFSDILDWSRDYLDGSPLAAVGHRVVHGGRAFADPIEITEAVLEALIALTPLAPLHQPRCLQPIQTIRALRPEVRQIACFDTAFHHGLTPPVSRFALPRRLEEIGIRRYGFHGLSFEFIARRLAEIGPALASKRTVVAHLGNGASLCAMRNGKSLDTTMGLTPLDGLVMGTRCGAIDPGVLLYLQQRMPADAIEHLLYQESGLFGVSGISADMRTLLASDEPAAREAIDLFTFRVAREVAAMTNTLGGLECLVFTGGIGEHSSEIRQHICERLRWAGVSLEISANAQGRERIGTADSNVDILTIPSSEETTIARHCAAVLRG